MCSKMLYKKMKSLFLSALCLNVVLFGVGLEFVFRAKKQEMATIQDDLSEVAEFQSLFRELGLNVEPKELGEWLSSDCNDTGCEVLTDAEICDLVSAPHIDSEENHDHESHIP